MQRAVDSFVPASSNPPPPPPILCTESRRRDLTRAPRFAAVFLAALWAAGGGEVAAQSGTVEGVSIAAPASGDTFRGGETITVTVDFVGALNILNPSQVMLQVGIGSVTRNFNCTNCVGIAGRGEDKIYFSYTVQSGDVDPDGISIAANALVGGTIQRLVPGNPLVTRSFGSHAIANSANHKVDGSLGAPRVDAVALNAPVLGDTFERGEVIEATVTFNRAVDVTGTPQLALTIGSNTRQADYASGTGTTRLVFRYTVVQADSDPNGVSIAAAALTLNSGTIDIAGGTLNALLGLGSHAVSNSGDHLVNGATLTAAAVNGASISSRPRGRGSYGAGERIEVRVRFDRAVDVTGTPQLALTIGEETRQADYASGTGTATLSFSYEVVAEDVDEDGVSVAADALTLNGGEIDDARSATAAAGLDLGTNAIRDAAGHRVNFVIEDDDGGGPPGPAPPEPPAGVEAASDGGGSVTISWAHPGDPDVASYEYLLQRAGRTVGDWRTVPGSDADTTSVTIDLTTGEARAVNNAAPPAAWTILLRARDRNGNAGGIARTTVTAAGTPVPAVPAAWLGVQAVLLLWCRRRRSRAPASPLTGRSGCAPRPGRI